MYIVYLILSLWEQHPVGGIHVHQCMVAMRLETCPVSEDESELNSKFCLTAFEDVYSNLRTHLRDLNVVWKPHTKPLLLQYIPHAQRDFPHSPANQFLLFRNVLSCSYRPHIVSVLIDIHS